MATQKANDDTFETAVLKAQGPVLVDFWAEWCGPCKMIGPALEEISENLADKIAIVKVNVDEAPMTPSRYGVKGIPTLMLFENGKVQATRVGASNKSKLESWINDQLQAKAS